MYTQGQIRIESELPIESVDILQLNIRRGEHGKLALQGSVAEENDGEVIFGGLENSTLKLYADQELLFCGLIDEIKITHEGQKAAVELYGISATIKLDQEKKSRSLQDTEMTYEESMRKVLKETPGAILGFHARNRVLETPAYQLEETDWEWIKRMAGYLGEVPVAWVYSEEPALEIGLVQGQTYHGADDAVEEKVWQQNKRVYRQLRGKENWNIGEGVIWKQQEYVILEKSCSLEKGLLWFYYTIARKEAFQIKARYNPNFTGRRLPARVLERKDEEVRVKFEMDTTQEVDKAYWYPWCPVSGNFLYCMPETGESVFIELENADGSRAKAVEGVHGNGKGNPEMIPDERLFTTKHNKRIKLSKEKMSIQDLEQKEPLQLLLNDLLGIEVRSNRKLTVWAKGDIGLKGNRLYFQAPKEISLVRKDGLSPTVINMCNGFDSIGQTNQVVTEKEVAVRLPAFESKSGRQGEEKEYSLQGIEQEILASTPVRQRYSRLDQQIGGCKVEEIGNG